MRLLLVLSLAAVLSFAASVKGESGKSPLEGCADVDALAAALAKLHESEWRDVTLDRLRSVWPTEIHELYCDPGGCHVVWSMDRIIRGHYQCTAHFTFKIQGSAAKPRTKWLDDVAINYSSRERGEIVLAAKKFAAALGLTGPDLETVGTDSYQHFDWESCGRREREITAMNLRLTHDGDLWHLNLNSAQNIPE